MTPALFRRIGESLYGIGHHWPALLAVDLAVATRTCQRWASGARDIPPIEGELSALVHERIRDLEKLAVTLEGESVEG